MKKLLLLYLLTSLGNINYAQTGCPGCVPAIPSGLTQDTVFFEQQRDAILGVPFDDTLSFRLPMTTNSVPGAPTGINIDQIEIVGVSGLAPYGLDYTLSQSIFINAPRDGCVRICGTPTQAGEIIVNIQAIVVVFGLRQPYNFPLTLNVIDPNAILNPGTGCAPLEVTFNAKPDPTTETPVTYAWNFGNGANSTLENPVHTYTTPGTYTVTLTSTLRAYQLTSVNVFSTSGGYCQDAGELLCTCGTPIVGQCPDLFIDVTNAGGATLYDGSNNVVANQQAAAFTNLSVNLRGTPCAFRIWDQDNPTIFDQHDKLDSIAITLVAGTRNFTGSNTTGSYTVALVTTGTETHIDTVTVNNCSSVDFGGLSQVAFDVFPNPTNGELNISLGLNVQSEAIIELYDMAGRKLTQINLPKASQHTEKLDLSHLPAGVYQLHVNVGGYNLSRRVVVGK